MSNPLIAPRSTLSETQAKLSMMPQAYFTPEELIALGRSEETGKLVGRRGISIEEAASKLGVLDMDPHYSFYLNAGECFDPSLQKQLQLKGRVLATAQSGSMAPRRRTYSAMVTASAMYSNLEEWRGVGKTAVEDRCSTVIYAQGGTKDTLGRLLKYYPRRDRKVAQLKPVTRREAQEAIRRCGMVLDEQLSPFVFEGEGLRVSINPQAENGFPYMGKWEDEMTHAPILEKATQIQAEIRRAHAEDPKQGVWKWLRAMEQAPETLRFVCLRGKCKADPYKKEKLVGQQMRFYNVFPRQILLNLMKVTQVMDGASRHISTSDHMLTSAIGVTLVRGGAEDMVRALDRMLDEDGVAYVHVGDDSWVIFEWKGTIHMFSVDCSSFDLTQESSVTKEIHMAIRDELVKVDGPAGQLWYAYARERCVVVVNSQVYRWKHAGPSGFPLQSKINDALMDVYLRRVLAKILDVVKDGTDLSKGVISSSMEAVGRDMGLVARLEDYEEVRASSLVEALEVTPFKFIGFHFYAEEGRVYVVADVVRQLSQIPYPNSFWVDKKALVSMEAVRLAGIYVSLGRPPLQWRPAFEAYRDQVIQLLKQAIKSGNTGLEWLPENAFVGVSGEDVRSLEGLLRAVTRSWDILWGHEGELVADTYLLSKEVQVTENVRNMGRGVLLVTPPTHPPTMRNLGRPPPTVRWGPPKQPRGYATLYERVSGIRRRAGYAAPPSTNEMDDAYSYYNSEFEEEEYDEELDPSEYGFGDLTLRGGRRVRLWGRARELEEDSGGDDYDDYLPLSP